MVKLYRRKKIIEKLKIAEDGNDLIITVKTTLIVFVFIILSGFCDIDIFEIF